MFNQINRLHFVVLINNTITQLLTMTTRNIFRFIGDLIFNRILNNLFFRLIVNTPGINPSVIIDTKAKKIFWISFVSTLILYRQFLLFKKFILWPFKLGIYSFLYAISGLDVSWFLGWFDIFKINIPQWVYIQYLSLYTNWIDWWKGTVQIKNLHTESMVNHPSIPKTNTESVEIISSDNKIINKKKFIILAGIVTLIGIGIWYFSYPGTGSGNGGTVNGNSIIVPDPPAPNTNDVPHTITIIDNQTVA